MRIGAKIRRPIGCQRPKCRQGLKSLKQNGNILLPKRPRPEILQCQAGRETTVKRRQDGCSPETAYIHMLLFRQATIKMIPIINHTASQEGIILHQATRSGSIPNHTATATFIGTGLAKTDVIQATGILAIIIMKRFTGLTEPIGGKRHSGVLSDQVLLRRNIPRMKQGIAEHGREGVGIQNGFARYRYILKIIRIIEKNILIRTIKKQPGYGQAMTPAVNRAYPTLSSMSDTSKNKKTEKRFILCIVYHAAVSSAMIFGSANSAECRMPIALRKKALQ